MSLKMTKALALAFKIADAVMDDYLLRPDTYPAGLFDIRGTLRETLNIYPFEGSNLFRALSRPEWDVVREYVNETMLEEAGLVTHSWDDAV